MSGTEQRVDEISCHMAYVSDGLAGLAIEAIDTREASWIGCICQVFSEYVADTSEMFEELVKDMKAGYAE